VDGRALESAAGERDLDRARPAARRRRQPEVLGRCRRRPVERRRAPRTTGRVLAVDGRLPAVSTRAACRPGARKCHGRSCRCGDARRPHRTRRRLVDVAAGHRSQPIKPCRTTCARTPRRSASSSRNPCDWSRRSGDTSA
jgi:hypothetical protein